MGNGLVASANDDEQEVHLCINSASPTIVQHSDEAPVHSAAISVVIVY